MVSKRITFGRSIIFLICFEITLYLVYVVFNNNARGIFNIGAAYIDNALMIPYIVITHGMLNRKNERPSKNQFAVIVALDIVVLVLAAYYLIGWGWGEYFF